MRSVATKAKAAKDHQGHIFWLSTLLSNLVGSLPNTPERDRLSSSFRARVGAGRVTSSSDRNISPPSTRDPARAVHLGGFASPNSSSIATMGCCGSKGQYAVEEPGAYEARREKMLEAADRRNAQSAMRGIQNPRSAARLREEQSKPARTSEFQARKDEQMVRDWGS